MASCCYCFLTFAATFLVWDVSLPLAGTEEPLLLLLLAAAWVPLLLFLADMPLLGFFFLADRPDGIGLLLPPTLLVVIDICLAGSASRAAARAAASMFLPLSASSVAAAPITSISMLFFRLPRLPPRKLLY